MQTTPFPHQEDVFVRLMALAKTCFQFDSRNLPIRPRFNSLIVGPSGSGKTYLAQAVAESLNIPILHLSVADWVLLSCQNRGSKITWHTIVVFLYQHRYKEGVLILCDEIQHACGDCAWERFLRVELFTLLDQKIPEGLEVDIEMKSGVDITLQGESMRPIEEMLKKKTFVLGAGAFQEIWNERSNKIGFREETTEKMPTSSNLTKTLPTELINRFRLDLLILKPLSIQDYEQMLEVVAEKLDTNLREHFLKLGRARLPEVHRLRQGSRFLEELMTDALLLEKKNTKPFVHNLTDVTLHDDDPWNLFSQSAPDLDETSLDITNAHLNSSSEIK